MAILTRVELSPKSHTKGGGMLATTGTGTSLRVGFPLCRLARLRSLAHRSWSPSGPV